MVVGIGLDVVEVARIEDAMQNPRFAERILTPAEREQPSSPMRMAGRWAAKEAVAKALSIGLAWHDVEIGNDPAGKPFVVVRHPAFEPGLRVSISISHERGIAAAVAIVTRD